MAKHCTCLPANIHRQKNGGLECFYVQIKLVRCCDCSTNENVSREEMIGDDFGYLCSKRQDNLGKVFLLCGGLSRAVRICTKIGILGPLVGQPTGHVIQKFE